MKKEFEHESGASKRLVFWANSLVSRNYKACSSIFMSILFPPKWHWWPQFLLSNIKYPLPS